MKRRAHTAAWVIAAIAPLLPAPAAQGAEGSEGAKLAIVRPGGGFLVADGSSIVPLEIISSLPDNTKILDAKVTANAGGRIIGAKLVAENALMFWYQAPKKNNTFKESFEVTLKFPDGDRSETFPVEIPPPLQPPLDLLVEPNVLDDAGRRAKKAVMLNATVRGRDLVGLNLSAGPGTLGEVEKTRFTDAIRAAGTVTTGELPHDQPSYVLALAAAATPRGFNAKTGGVPVEAPIRISLEIQPKAELSIEGASNNPPPVIAPADGRTVVDHVVVRYGAEVRAFAKRAGKKSEVSLAIPSLISPGVAIAIPGQNVADGGTGMSILVAVPPSPFGGGEPIWPEIALEGATLLSAVKIAPDIRALVVRRPEEPAAVAVMLDDQRAATIEFGARHGTEIQIASTYAKSDERGAVDVWVKDASGAATDLPAPRIKTKDGKELEISRVETGKYRAVLPLSFSGPQGTEVTVVAEIPPPPFLAGEAIEFARSTTRVKLSGTGGPIASPHEGGGSTRAEAQAERRESGARMRFALGATAGVGTTFNKLLLVAGGVNGEFRPPVFDARLALRLGLELERLSGSGTLSFMSDNATETLIAGLYIPFDVGFAVVSLEHFELVVRGGAAVRIENGVLRASGDTIAGASRVGFGAQAAIEAAIRAGSGAFVFGGTIGGIGADATGFSSEDKTIEGALTSVRFDAGYKLWF